MKNRCIHKKRKDFSKVFGKNHDTIHLKNKTKRKAEITGVFSLEANSSKLKRFSPYKKSKNETKLSIELTDYIYLNNENRKLININ